MEKSFVLEVNWSIDPVCHVLWCKCGKKVLQLHFAIKSKQANKQKTAHDSLKGILKFGCFPYDFFLPTIPIFRFLGRLEQPEKRTPSLSLLTQTAPLHRTLRPSNWLWALIDCTNFQLELFKVDQGGYCLLNLVEPRADIRESTADHNCPVINSFLLIRR